MLSKSRSLLSPRHRWKASLGAPQGELELPVSHRTFSTRHSRTPNTLGSCPDCWMPSEDKAGGK